LCFLLKKKEEPVACLWLARERYSEDVFYCDFIMPPNVLWDFDVVVLPHHRLGVAFALLWSHALRWAAERNIRWIYSRIAVMSRYSVQVHQRLGGIVIGNLMFFKLGRIQLCCDMMSSQLSLHKLSSRKKIDMAEPPYSAEL
jgi:hypothetical protein